MRMALQHRDGSSLHVKSANGARFPSCLLTRQSVRIVSHQNMEMLLEHHDAVLVDLLPALTNAVGATHESGDTRFLCLKVRTT